MNITAKAVRDFVVEKVVPLEHDFLNQGPQSVFQALDELRGEAREQGIWTPFLHRDGGANLSLSEFAPLAEAMGWSLLGHYVFNCQAPDAGNMELLAAHGSDAQRKRWLTPLAAGEIRSCFGMTEPQRAGSNPVWMDTRAELKNGRWVINGRKWFATGADGAAFCIVMAVTEANAPKPHQCASMIIVPLGTAGLSEVRRIRVMGEEGAGNFSHSELAFDNVEVSEDALLGARGAGFKLAQARLGPGRIHHCMRWVGICERALDLTCRHTICRELKPGVSLADQQQIQTWIADSRAEINAARLMVMDAARAIDERGSAGARDEIAAIKFFVAGILQRVLDRAIQAHGAKGMSDDTPLAFWYRHERAARVYDGPDEVHRAQLARNILKGYREAKS